MTPDSTESGARLIVVGSVNQDYFTYVDEFPAPGQTVLARSAAVGIGGKGANQALAAAALGCPVRMVGAVGSDSAAATALAGLAAGGVDTTAVERIPDELTGAAYITVSATGENTIVVSSAANARLQPASVDTRLGMLGLRASDVLLCQGELSTDVVERVARLADRTGARFVLNLAPVIPISIALLESVTVLVVNEGEAAELRAALGSTDLSLGGGLAVVVTLGARGASLTVNGVTVVQPAPRPAKVVDTTGAGDAFVGAFAAAMVAGLELPTALRAGVCAGTAAVETAGTVTSYVTGVTPNELAARAPEMLTGVTA